MSFNFKHPFFIKTPVFTGFAAFRVNNICPIIYTMLTRIGSGFQRKYSYRFVTEKQSEFKQISANNFHKFLICLLLNSSPTMPP